MKNDVMRKTVIEEINKRVIEAKNLLINHEKLIEQVSKVLLEEDLLRNKD